MKRTTILTCLAPALLGTGLAVSSADAAVIYREIFGTTLTDPGVIQESMSVSGWQGTRSNGSAFTPSLCAEFGRPTNLGSVNAGTPVDHEVQDYGFVNMRQANGNDTYLLATSEKVIDRATLNANNLAFSWYQGTDTYTLSTRLAIQIGTQWYVSDKTFLNTDANNVVTNLAKFDERAQKYSISLDDAGGFHQLTVTTGTGGSITMAPGTSALPGTGDMVAFGLWTSKMGNGEGATGGRLTFDTFEVHAEPIPEPAALGLLTLAGVLGLRRRR